MNTRQFLRTLASGAALAAVAAHAAAPAWLDLLDAPARPSPLAARGLLNGLALAGSRLVAVGQRGHIVLSDDAGGSWRQAGVPVSSDLVAVHFPTPQAGWAVGHDGVILHSSDHGASWRKQRDGRPDQTDVPLLDVWFQDAATGYAVGAFGLALRTTDGGARWEPMADSVDNPKKLHLYAVRGIGDALYLAGEQGLLLRLDRATGRFRALVTPYQGTLFGLTGRAGTVLAHGLRGNLVRSTDGGASWQSVPTGIQVGLTASAIDADGRIVLASQAGHLLVSRDDGASFTPARLERPVPAAAVALLPRGTAVIAGPRGVHAIQLP